MIANLRLKDKLKEHNLTARELAKLIDVSENSVSQYIMGRRCPKWTRAHQIAEILHTTSDYLFTLHRNTHQKCKTCDMPFEIKDRNTSIRNNTGSCSFCYLIKERG